MNISIHLQIPSSTICDEYFGVKCNLYMLYDKLYEPSQARQRVDLLQCKHLKGIFSKL